MELNNIKTKDISWGEAASTLNENFGKISTDVEKIKNAAIKNKGYFSSSADLISAFPSAQVGDYAYVGSQAPYQTWQWTNEGWIKLNDDGGAINVDLNNYYPKSEVDGKLTELGSKVTTPLITNVFSPNTITEGKYAHYLGYGTNTLVDLEGAMVSDFIPVKPNQYVMEVGAIGAGGSKNNRSFLWYDDSQKKKADGQLDWVQGELKQVPEGCYYIRVSASAESVGTMMLLVSDVVFDVPTEYIPFGNSIGGESKIEINSREIAKTKEKVEGVEIDLSKLENNILTASIINVFNPNTITEGKYAHYLGYGTNTLVDLEGAMVSDFIPVKPNQYVMEVGAIGAGGSKNNRSFLWYDDSQKKKADGQLDWVQGELKQVPEGCYYIRVSASAESVGTMMLLVSDVVFDVPTEYIPFGNSIGGESKIEINKRDIQLLDESLKELEKRAFAPDLVNLFDKTKAESNKSVNQVYGFISDANGKFVSDFIPVKPTQYVMEVGGISHLNNSTASSYCWYDNSKTMKAEGLPTWEQGELKQVPDGCYYLRITNVMGYEDSLMIIVGDSEFAEPESYIAYGEEIKGELKVNSAKPNQYNGLYGVVMGDSHSTNRMMWVPRMFEKIGLSYEMDVIDTIIGDSGANNTGKGYEDYCDPTYAQAVRVVEQYNNGHNVDYVVLQNTHYVENNVNVDDVVPFKVDRVIDGGSFIQSSSNEENWFNENFISMVSKEQPKYGTLVKTTWNTTTAVISFSGTPIVGKEFTINFNGVKYATTVDSGDTLTTFVQKMGTYVFGENEWMTTASGNSITLTFVGANYVEPSISYDNGGSGISASHSFSTATTRKYRYYNSYDLTHWTDKNYWIIKGAWEINSLMGAIEYLLSNIEGVTIVAVAFPALAIGKNEFISVAEMKASNKWRYHRTNCDNLLNVAMHYGLKRIDLDDCWGVTLPNWFMYMNENDAHPKKEGYQRIADTICRELG